MSVILYEDEKFLKIYQNLTIRGSELAHLWKYPKDWNKFNGMDYHFKTFLSELRRANTATWNRQYPDALVPLTTLDFHCVLPYPSTIQLVKSLQGLSYNLIDNDGNESNLCNCAKRLHELIYDLMSQIISNLPAYHSCDVW